MAFGFKAPTVGAPASLTPTQVKALQDMVISPGGALASTKTRAHHKPTAGMTNVSLDFNAAPSGKARGTEVIIPDNASPAMRAAAERYNQLVVDFAAAHGIKDYPNRGVRTRSENGRGVSHTVHTEPFFNTDAAMQDAIKNNMGDFATLYSDAFGSMPNTRIIAPHGIGNDRGAASDFFGNETDFGVAVIKAMMGHEGALPVTPQSAYAKQAAAGHANGLMSAGVDPGLAHAAASSAYDGGGPIAPSAPPQAQPELSRQDRMAMMGQSLMALDRGESPMPYMMARQSPVDLSGLAPFANAFKGFKL
jgi:hypothetical protein